MLTNEMIEKIHQNAVNHGWWDEDKSPDYGEVCALIHCEISEAMEAYRNGEADEYIANDGKPEGVWVELADVVIRCADVLAAWGYSYRVQKVVPDVEGYPFGHFVSLLHLIVSNMYLGINTDYLRGLDGIYANCDIIERQLHVLIFVIYQYAEHNNIDLDGIIERKHQYNVTRPYRHGGKRL